MLLRLALQIARDDYEDRRRRQRIELAKSKGKYGGRKADKAMHERILALRPHHSIAVTAKLAGCSQSTVKTVCRPSGNKAS
jgi:DNA invertase Pin-like site-specific DNA recombinase